MQLIDVLDERIIDLSAEATNKDEVLTLLAGKLKDAGYIADVECCRPAQDGSCDNSSR